jgi:hypothetical protein
MVGTLDAVHSLMAPRFSDGLRKMATSGRWEFAAMGPRPKLLCRRRTRGEEERVRLIPTGGKKGKKEERSQEVASEESEIEKCREQMNGREAGD